jgi:anthranilate synthase/aminodeoxychorismate synthase-like glutamine amidotransferase
VILLIDNYDSFVYNLARYLERLGQETLVVRNTAIDVSGVRALGPAAIVLSPGPCAPRQAGCSLEIVERLYQEVPILGVCLGHQAIAEGLGGRIVRAREPVHGRTSRIRHDGRGVFCGLPDPIVGCRYHSLVVDEDSLPKSLEVSARTDDGTVMALRHRRLPVVGLQFHPESILTETGYCLLAGFLRRAGLELPAELPSIESELRQPAPRFPEPRTEKGNGDLISVDDAAGSKLRS